MKSIKINDVDSWTDLRLAISSYSIGVPEVKQYKTDLPGGDGEVDFTEFFGRPLYRNRTLEFSFVYGLFYGETIPMSKVQDMLNSFHGKTVDIELSWDLGWIYTGRLMFEDFVEGENFARFNVMVDCLPYKMGKAEYSVTKTISTGGSTSIDLPNYLKPATPTLTISNSATIVLNGGASIALTAGTHKIPTLLQEENTLVVTAVSGTVVTVKYKRGRL